MKELVLSGLFNYVFFGLALILVIFSLIRSFMIGGREWFGSEAKLVITGSKIFNSLNYYASGDILIEDITGQEILQVGNQMYLAIRIKNISAFIQEKSFFKRHILKRAVKKFGTPLVIAEGSTEIDLVELKGIIGEIKNTSHFNEN